MARIPKRWKWMGDLYIDVSPERAERICTAVLSDPSEPRPNGLRFSICLDSVDSLRLAKLYNVHDVFMLLRACDPVQQFAMLGSQTDDDAGMFKTFAAHLKRKHLCTYAHLFLDSVAVAILLVFPSSLKDLCMFLKVPRDFTQGDFMVAALIPWTLAADEYENMQLLRPRSPAPDNDLLDPALADTVHDAGHKLANRPFFYRALRVLKCPRDLLDYLSQRERPYCIWHSPADGTTKRPGFETSALQHVLKTHRAKNVGYKADVRFVFIHVGALSTFHKFGALAMRRNKQPELRFMTYGTHDSVHPERWGMRCIYPLGGVVTFTPSAILENLVGAYELIKKIAERPLWTCYILPSVVAMLAKLTCQGSHPLTLFDKGEFIFDELLELIESGKLSLLQAPPLSRALSGSDSAITWIGQQFKMLRMNARDILEECIALSRDQYANVQESELPLAIEREISRDLWNMQLQPVIMDEYRRFVVVNGRSDRFLTGDDNGVECVSLKQFDFKDDYYDKEANDSTKTTGKLRDPRG
ncbi:hypothetical protein B0H21DRAFT_316591 [Amylocystis lapponica]|nr:hypothetical protein B0H21DRAFT_316591 [Amylocystis lapponica]